MDVEKAINSRFSCRRFMAKKPDWKKIIDAVESASKAPLAGNIQTIKFILISDKKIIQELAKAASQDFVSTVRYIVVVCSDKKQCTLSYDRRGEGYSHQQVGAAIENFLLRITSLGLASCWVGAFSDSTVRRILDIPEEVEPIAILPIGYAMGKQKQRTKTSIEHLLYFDKWKNKTMTPIRKVEAR